MRRGLPPYGPRWTRACLLILGAAFVRRKAPAAGLALGGAGRVQIPATGPARTVPHGLAARPHRGLNALVGPGAAPARVGGFTVNPEPRIDGASWGPGWLRLAGRRPCPALRVRSAGRDRLPTLVVVTMCGCPLPAASGARFIRLWLVIIGRQGTSRPKVPP